MKRAILIVTLFLSGPLLAEQIKPMYNPATGKIDLITALSTTSIAAGTGIAVTTTTSGVTITATGGGGASSLEVFSTFDGTRSSPTASISIGDALKLSVTGSTAVVTVDFSSVPSRSDVILNQNTLQSGSTFYVSSGTVNGTLIVNESTENKFLRMYGDTPGTGPKNVVIHAKTKEGFGVGGQLFIVASSQSVIGATGVAKQTSISLYPPISSPGGGAIMMNMDGITALYMEANYTEMDADLRVNRGIEATYGIKTATATLTSLTSKGCLGTNSSGDVIEGNCISEVTPGSTNYIQVRNTLQSGSTFYVSSGTVTNLNVANKFVVGNGLLDYVSPHLFFSSPLDYYALRAGYGEISIPSNGGALDVSAEGYGSVFSVINNSGVVDLQVTNTLDVLGDVISTAGVSGDTVTGNTVTASTDLVLASLLSKDCLGTDGSGNVIEGTCTGGGASSLEVFSPTAQSSPTTSISIAAPLKMTVSGSTAIVTVDVSSVTLQGNNLSETYLTNSSATATYFNKLAPYISSANVNASLTVTANGTAGATPTFSANPSSVTLYGASIPASAIAAGSLGSSVLASSFPVTGVTAGSYTNTNMTVDAQGRVTAASNGTVGSSVNGRLSLTSGVAITTSNVTSAGTLYFTPYNGNKISLYESSNWVLYSFSQLSLSLTLTSGKNYDVFVYNNSGTLTLELSAAWTTDTERADAVILQDGVYVKSSNTTRRLVGTIRASGTNVTEDSTSRRFVWNLYNRVERIMRALETTDSWTYTTATFREANGGSTPGVSRFDYVVGFSEDYLDVQVYVPVITNAAIISTIAGIGIDSSSVNSANLFYGFTHSDTFGSAQAFFKGHPGIGYHSIRWLEFSTASGTTTWYGDNVGLAVGTGMHGTIKG